MAIYPIICLFYYLLQASMYDVAYEFACAASAETISANAIKLSLYMMRSFIFVKVLKQQLHAL